MAIHRRHVFHSLRLVGLAAVLALALPTGCAQRATEERDEAVTPIRFAYQDRVADAVSMIAVEKGFFREEGIAIEPLVFSSGPACSETLLAGSADIGTMGDTTAVIAVARSPVKIIASHGGGEHRHRIMVAQNSPIQSPADLVGRRLAVNRGTSTYGGLLVWAQSVNLDLSRVNVTEMRPDDMGDALLSGAVDAIVASEPTPSVIEQHGGRELATLGGLGNTYPILLVARTDFLTAHPEAVTAFLRAMTRAARFVEEQPQEAAQVVAAKSGLPLETAQRAMSHHYYSLQLGDETRSSLEAIAAFLVSQDTLESPPDLSATMDDSFLRTASTPEVTGG
jgi:aliphatic sulfonates family ABC transporter substrate-binding protein